MPRPCKRRRVCTEPVCAHFGPRTAEDPREIVTMTVEEYETIRLIDWLGLTQEQCALRMNVARTTAQSIYAQARRKLARCLVEQRELRITGGDYVLCDGQDRCGSCRQHCGHAKENKELYIPQEENP